jgi:hypothetical protein
VSADVAQLAALWLECKALEASATERRLDVERAMIAALGAKTEGSTTHRVGSLAVTLTGKLSYTAPDTQALYAAAPELFRPSLNDTAVRRLRESDPARYRELSGHLVVKPAKTAVSIRLLEEAA